MNTNRKVFWDFSPTLGAELRGVFSWDFNYQTTSLRRFVSKYVEELKPSHISHRPVEIAVSIPRIELFYENSIVFFKELVSYFEMKVPSLVSHFLVGFSNQYSSFPPSVRAFDPTREPLLSLSKYIARLLKEARIFHLLPIRGGEERFAADIYTNNPIGLGQWLLGYIVAREAYIPFACRASPDGYRLYVTFNGARETELKSAHISDKKVFAIKPPASLFQGEAIISVLTLEPGKAWLFTILNTAKEALKGFVQSLNHILKNLGANHSIFWEGGFKLRKLLNLVKTGYRTLVLAIDGDALLKGGIVEPSAKSEPTVGFLECPRIRLKAILKRLFHLPCTTSTIAVFGKGGKRAFIPALKGGVFSPAIL